MKYIEIACNERKAKESDNMREHVIKLYKFDELNAEAKENAISNYRNFIDWDFESKSITDFFVEYLTSVGYPTEDIEWCLSYSQGDGVAFYGDVDLNIVVPRLLDAEYVKLYEKMLEEGMTVTANIYRNSYGYRYSHYNTMEVEVDGDYIETFMEYLYDELDEESDEYVEKYNEIEDFFTTLRDAIHNDIKDVSRHLEGVGYEVIEHIESDENIIEMIKLNGYEFTEEGKLYW